MRSHGAWVIGIALVTAAVAAADAGNKARKRPSSTTIKAPKGAKPVKVPEGVKTTPPPDRWWEAEAPCPAGATLETEEHKGVTTIHRCIDAERRVHGPATSLDRKGKIFSDSWHEHGVLHGLLRVAPDRPGTKGYVERVNVDGERHGDAREWGSSGQYRKGVRHGRWVVLEENSSPQHGHYVDGKREGTWLTVVELEGEDVVVARATYKADAIKGEVVWWTEGGELLATIKTSRTGRRWKLHLAKGVRLTATCSGGGLAKIELARKAGTLSCAYDPESRERKSERVTGSIGLACPELYDKLPYAFTLCTGDLLDPLVLVSELGGQP